MQHRKTKQETEQRNKEQANKTTRNEHPANRLSCAMIENKVRVVHTMWNCSDALCDVPGSCNRRLCAVFKLLCLYNAC